MSVPTRRRWTEAEDALARELAADGYTMADVAAELGRSVSGVRCRHMDRGGRFGFRRGGEPDVVQRSAVLSLVGAGLSGSAVARRVGRSKQWVCRLLRKLERDGLVARAGAGFNTRWHVTKKWAGMDGPPEELGEWVARGDSLADIARRLGRDRKTVENWVREGKAS